MGTYVVDTNIVSLPTAPIPDEKAIERLARIEQVSFLAAPSLTELRWGVLRLPPGVRRDGLMEYLDGFIDRCAGVLFYDEAAAEWQAVERARLERIGQTPPFVDGQIAAIAAVNNLTLVTQNARDFERFLGLRVEAW
jgi:tRNA(fMet)-specific endonuclease VapC